MPSSVRKSPALRRSLLFSLHSVLRAAAHPLRAALLAALLLRAAGAPLEVTPPDGPAGDSSGEEEATPGDPLLDSQLWESIGVLNARHEAEFNDEFQHHMKHTELDNDSISSLPGKCPSSNFSKEACLRRVVEGLQTYRVLLKFAEKVYPNSGAVAEAKLRNEPLIELIKANMKKPERIKALASSQEVQLLRTIDNPDLFSRKRIAHIILRHYHNFLVDAVRGIRQRQTSKSEAMRNILYYQI